jgi:glycosyltransferase involved in cell wall biosynthesis
LRARILLNLRSNFQGKGHGFPFSTACACLPLLSCLANRDQNGQGRPANPRQAEHAVSSHYIDFLLKADAVRIVYVFNSLAMGGAERQGLMLAERMARRGHTVALLVLKPRFPDELTTTQPVVHLGMGKSPLSLIRSIAEAGCFLQAFHPDLLHSHSFHANFVARLLKPFVPRCAVLSTIHSVYEGPWHRMLAYRLTDWLSRRTIAVSQAAANRFVRLWAVPRPKCLVLTNGIDSAEFAPSLERRDRIRAEMGAESEFIWLAAGRLALAKDYPNLLRAFAQLRSSRPDARLWVAGETAGAQFQLLIALASRLNLSGHVRWLGVRCDVQALYDAADGFVLSSAWEGMPLAVGEAMAMEKPVVATDVGGVLELVGECGLLALPRNPDALAAAMLEVMGKPEVVRQAQGCTARERIVAHFSMDAKADEWETLYRSLLKRPHRSSAEPT